MDAESSPRLIRILRADDPFDTIDCFQLDGQSTWLLGRVDGPLGAQAPGPDIWSCDDAIMSGRHAEILCGEGGWSIRDLGSKNGTFVNGSRLASTHVLTDGDVVECGHSFFIFRDRLVVDGCGMSALPASATMKLLPLYYQIAPMYAYAASDLGLHLHGETGTGKEVVAQAIHALSGRSGPFIALNCAAISETLFESELFGHARGAFSGALQTHRGHVLAADGGTLFLDEIGELSLAMQAKLLRVLEMKEVLPVGGQSPVPVNFRLVSATLCDLSERVRTGRFRSDLHGRLGRSFTIPPLRENREELGRLIQTFLGARLSELVERNESPPSLHFTLAATRALVRHAWPYNVRELKQCIDGALMAALAEPRRGTTCSIDVRHLPAGIGVSTVTQQELPAAVTRAPEKQEALTDERLIQALAQVEGNRARAAKLLGMSDRTAFRRLKKLRADAVATVCDASESSSARTLNRLGD